MADSEIRDHLPSPIPSASLPIRRILTPLRRFLEIETASGAVLLVCACLSLVIANSPWHAAFQEFWHTPIVIGIGTWVFQRPLEFWVNDGLMTIFFFVVGLEIKRELMNGELNEWRKAALPVFGAIGGMTAPAMTYLLIIPPGPAQRGWGIPMATDIAFVVGIMALLGRRVPAGLKIFLLALAIVDDIGAVLIIAFAYTHHLSIGWLLIGMSGLGLVVVMNRLGARTYGVYVAIGILIWLAFLKAEVHPTVAGVILGLLTPARSLIPARELRFVAEDALHRIEGDEFPDSAKQRAILGNLAWAAKESMSPLERCEGLLHPLVGFVIMPIFALCNAGVALEIGHFNSPVTLAVIAGLAIGKPVGIVTFCFFAVRCGLARLPSKTHWLHMIAAGCLGGIGFTLAIFVAGLAFPGPANSPQLAAAKLSVLIGSVISAIAGSAWLLFQPKRSFAWVGESN